MTMSGRVTLGGEKEAMVQVGHRLRQINPRVRSRKDGHRYLRDRVVDENALLDK